VQSPLACGATVHPRFGPIWKRQGREISERTTIFREDRLSASIVEPARLARIEFVETATAREVRLRKRVK